MIGVFDSWFWWLQTLKYLKVQFPHEDFLFLADSKHVPYGDKSENEIKALTIKNISRLLDQWCHHVVIACNTAVASIYHHWFAQDIEKKLIAVTKCGVKEAILYQHKKVAVFATQATHDLDVYPTIYKELCWKWILYVVPTPGLVPLIESESLNYNKIHHIVDQYMNYISKDTDCLILGCTHYPILIDVFREKFPRIKIIDPGRSSVYTLDRRLNNKDMLKTIGRGNIHIYCTWDVKRFLMWAKKIWKTSDLPTIKKINI